MNNVLEKFDACVNSPNLGKRHQSLIDLIATILPIFNEEIGEIGDAAIREILGIQKRDEPKLQKELCPFSSESDGHNIYLYIVLGKISNNDQEYNVGIQAETPWQGDWDYLGWGGSDSMPNDIRALSREQVGIAAKRLAVAIFILDEVYRDPDSVLANMADALNKSGLVATDN